jgi:hypothetical protein
MLLTIGQSLNSPETTLDHKSKNLKEHSLNAGVDHTHEIVQVDSIRADQQQMAKTTKWWPLTSWSFNLVWEPALIQMVCVSNLSTQGFDYDLEIVLEILPRHHLTSELFCATDS